MLEGPERIISPLGAKQPARNRVRTVPPVTEPLRKAFTDNSQKIPATYAITEKGRTIANSLIASMKRGETALFASSNRPLLDEVNRIITSSNFAPQRLALFNDSSGKEVISDILQSVNLRRPALLPTERAAQSATNLEARLDTYKEFLKKHPRNSALSTYETICERIFRPTATHEESSFDYGIVSGWDQARFDEALAIAEKLDSIVERFGSPDKNPWSGSNPEQSTLKDSADIQSELLGLRNTLHEYRIAAKKLLQLLNLRMDLSSRQLRETLEALSIVDNLTPEGCELIRGINFRSSLWTEEPEKITEAIEAFVGAADAAQILGPNVKFDALAKLDLDSIEPIAERHTRKGVIRQLFDVNYERALQALAKVLTPPEDPRKVCGCLAKLRVLKDIQQNCDRYTAVIKEIFRDASSDPKQESRDYWYKQSQVCWAVQQFLLTVQNLPDYKRFQEIIKNPTIVQARSELCQSVLRQSTQYQAQSMQFLSQLGFDDEARLQFETLPLPDHEKRFLAMSDGFESLHGWNEYCETALRAKALSLDFLLNEAAITNDINPSLATGLRQAWSRSLVEESIGLTGSSGGCSPANQILLSERLKGMREIVERGETATAMLSYWEKLPRRDRGAEESRFCEALREKAELPPVTTLSELPENFLQKAKPILLFETHDLDPAKNQLSKLHFDQVINDNVPPSGEAEVVAAEKELDPFMNKLSELIQNECAMVVRPARSQNSAFYDLEVFSPRNLQRPVFAIHVDGQRYQQIDSAYNREVVPSKVCAEIGLPLLQEWIVDWYRDPEAQQQQFLNKVRELAHANI